MAESAGATQVHVFNGLVRAQLLDEAGNKVRTVELNTSEAARIEPAAAVVARSQPGMMNCAVAHCNVRPATMVCSPMTASIIPLVRSMNKMAVSVGQVRGLRSSRMQTPIRLRTGVRPGNLEVEGLVPQGNHAVQTPSKTVFGDRLALRSAACSMRPVSSKTKTACG